MNSINRISAFCSIAIVASTAGLAHAAGDGVGVLMSDPAASGAHQVVAKSASAQTLGTRATVTSGATLYGGFELASSATVYILIRGNSLGTLGVTQNYLDEPRLRIYNAQGQDMLIAANGLNGANFCLSSVSINAPVVSYYQSVRGQPVSSNDACAAGTFSAGVYTFTVTPSIPGVTTASTTSVPSSGEVLFEVTLNP